MNITLCPDDQTMCETRKKTMVLTVGSGANVVLVIVEYGRSN